MARCFWDLVKDNKSALVSAALLCVPFKRKYESKVCFTARGSSESSAEGCCSGQSLQSGRGGRDLEDEKAV